MGKSVELNKAAPDFTLHDFRGNQVTLSDFRGKKHVLLVFNRGFSDRFAVGIWRSCVKIMNSLSATMRKFW